MAGFAPPNPTLVEVGAQVLYYLGLSTAFGIGMAVARLAPRQVTQTGSVHTVALRKVDADWRLTAWAWAKGLTGV